MKNITNKDLKRMIDLMGNKKPINENKTISSVELIKKSSNGKFYGIVRETKKYFIKESTDGSNFNFIGGVANKTKNQFESYEQAVRRLNLMLEDTNVLTPDVIAEKKFVIKTKKKKSKAKPAEEEPAAEEETEEGGEEEFDFGGEETEEGGEEEFDFGGGETAEEGGEEEFDFGGEEGEGEETEEGGEEGGEEEFDFGGGDEEGTEEEGTEEESTEEETAEEGTEEETAEEGTEEFDSEDEDYDLEGDDSIKSIQRMTGKLGQKIRDTKDLASDTMKWVAKSVLSALDLEGMDSDDKKDLIRTIKKKKDEGSDEEFDFMGQSTMSYMNDDMVDWNQLTDEEKAQLVNPNSNNDVSCNHCNGVGHNDMTGEECEWCMGTGVQNMEDYMEDDVYGPGNNTNEKGEVLLDDKDEDNCSYCGDRDMPYDTEEPYETYPGINEPDWRSSRMDYMSKYAKNVKRGKAVKGQKIERHELETYLTKVKSKLGGDVSIDGDKVVGDFGYVEVTSNGYVLHKEGNKYGKHFDFDQLGKLKKEIGGDEDYMDNPYMMPQPAPARPQTRPETPVKPAKPDTDKPSPSKRPFTPPPHITPGEEPNPKAEYDEYGDEYYGPNKGMDYMEEPEYYGSFDQKSWYGPEDMGKQLDRPSYEYEENEYPDYESFRKSKFGKDSSNKWFAQGTTGERMFNTYRDKFGPMKIRSKRDVNYDETSEMFGTDYMEDDENMEICSACEGRGHEHGRIGFGRQTNPCITCAGTGMVPRMEVDGEVDEPYVDPSNPMGYEEGTSTLPKGMGHRYQYKEKFNFPFTMGENSSRNRKTLKEDHLNNKMVSYEQEMAYEDVEDMAREHGMDVELCHKDRAKDPEEQTIYLDLMKKGKAVAKIRINTAGDVEMGHMTGKVFKGEPVDSHSDFDEVLAEKGIKMMPQPAPSRPQTRPETPTKPAPTKPGTDKPSPSKRPFTPPPHITPGEEPNPKAKYRR